MNIQIRIFIKMIRIVTLIYRGGSISYLPADNVRLGAQLGQPAQAGQEEADIDVEDGQGRILDSNICY